MPPLQSSSNTEPQPPTTTLQVAVVGLGAFGSNHLRVYRELASSGYPVAISAIVEPDSTARSKIAAEISKPTFESIEECLDARAAGRLRMDAASVCVPTIAHFPVASALLTAGVDVLLEKPMTATLNEADTLIELARSGGRILQIGLLERFNPALLAVEPMLKRPMFFEAHRLSVFTPRSLDVDVVLDLMIHDLDIVLSIVKSPIRDLRAVGLPVLSGKVDIANVRIEFESGCVANFTASRVSTERVRKLRFFQPRQYVSIDYARKDLLVIDVAHGTQPTPASLPALDTDHPQGTPAGKPQGSVASPGLSFSKPTVASGEPLRLEIESFVQSVRTRSRPRVAGEDGKKALEVALRINEAIAEHSLRAGLDRFHL